MSKHHGPSSSFHRAPRDMADRVALGLTRLLRWTADTFFAGRYGHRAVVIETVAAVPGMVGAMRKATSATKRSCRSRHAASRCW